jgi:hypothetical protein
MKCWNSTFNTQGSKGVIVTVHVRVVKIYVVIVEAFKKKERQGETQKTIKLMVLKFSPPI